MRLYPRPNIGETLEHWLNEEMTLTGNTNHFKITLFVNAENETVISGDDIFYTLMHDYSKFHVYSAETLVDFMFDWNRFVRIHTHDFERMYTALMSDYNPIENYDKHSEITNNGSTGANANTPFTTRTYQVSDDTVNAAGDGAFIPQTKVSTEGKTDTTNTMTEHTHGNIGVTKSSDMVRDEIALRTQYNLIESICRMYAEMELI